MALVDEKLRHLLSLRPNEGPKSPEKCMGLARSFLALETLWGNALGVLDEYPCIDLAGHLGQAELPQRIEDAFSESTFARSTAEARACRNYLRWCCLTADEASKVSEFGLADPFVPLIELFEEGAEFSLEGWMFDVFKCGGINVRGLRTRVLENKPIS